MKSKKAVLCFLAAAVVTGATAWWSFRDRGASAQAKSPAAPSLTAEEKQRQANLNRLKFEGITPAARRSDFKDLTETEKQARQIARPTLLTSLLDLDLSRPPTEKELIQAGQLGDALSPTATADPEKIPDPARREWQKKDNLVFGKAIQAWNEHRYDQAIELFHEHIADHPDSPWAAESKMHIGCAAQYRGEYDVCYEQFGDILATTEKGTDIYQKALLRTANIYTMQGLFEQASSTYAEALKTEKNINRAGYASSWMPILSMYKKNETALRDCVQKSLREVCSVQGKKAEAERVEAVSTLRKDGFTAAQVLDLCRDLGMEPQAMRVKGKDVTAIPVPYLAHYTDEHFVAVFQTGEKGLRIYDSRVGFQREIDHNSFRAQWSGFAIALGQKPDTHHDIVAVSVPELNSIIGGCCGVMASPSPLGSPSDEKGPCAAGPKKKPETDGTGGPPTANGDEGGRPPSPAPPPADPGPPPDDSLPTPPGMPGFPSPPSISSGRGTVSWSINPVSYNMTTREVPMWWNSPYGLDIDFVLTFNSQDTLNAIRPFGPRWVLNYCAYAMEDPSGKVTIVGGNGRQWVLNPNGSGGYTAPADFHCSLVKTGTYEFELTYLESGTVYKYGRPAGVSTSASLFTKVTDRWGVSISISHNSHGAITAVTHSIGGIWDLIYNSAGSRVERIDEPFGRSAYFSYDSNGDLREVINMGEGQHAYRYSTSANPVNSTPSSSMFMTEIVYAPQELASAGDANRTWFPLTYRFLTNPPDGLSSGTWQTYRVTTTHPTGGKEIHYYDGIDTGSFRSAGQVTAGTSATTFSYTLSNGEGRISNITYAGGGTASNGNYIAGVPRAVTKRDGVAKTYTLNSLQRPLTITNAASQVTTMEYESNGMDLKKVISPDSAVALEIKRNANRLPEEVTYRDGQKITTTYTAEGQPETIETLDANAVTVQTDEYTYDANHRVETVKRDGQTVMTYTYDSFGHVHTTTDAEGTILTYAYDGSNRVIEVTYPDNTKTQTSYHPITGMKNWVRHRDGQMTLYFYDRSGRLVGERSPGQRFTYYSYNLDGKVTELIDPNGSSTRWEYDIEGRLLRKTTADGGITQYAYNTKGQTTQKILPRGLKFIYTYDSLARLSGVSYQNSSGGTAFPPVTYTYDSLGRLENYADGEGTTTYGYDTGGRLASINGPYGSDTVSYGYDDAGRITAVTTPGSVLQTMAYDAEGRAESWSDPFGDGVMTYSGITSRVLGISRSGGLVLTAFDYTPVNDMQNLKQIRHEVDGDLLSQFDYTTSARQNFDTWTRTLGTTAARETRYEMQHDFGHQLTGATLKQVSDNTVIENKRWGFDPGGNRNYEHDLLTNVHTQYSHNMTNALSGRKVYSSGQKPWVQGSLDEPGRAAIGGRPVVVQADQSFQGQAPARTTSVAAIDTAGNLTEENWQFNSGSGGTPDSSLSYTHDSEGNLLGDGTSTFEWDLKNRLTAIVTGAHRTEYSYDGSDRRVRVVEKESSVTQSDLRYVYCGRKLLEERASDNSTVLKRFYSGGHVDVADSGKRYTYTMDHLGSVREVLLLDGTSGNPASATLAARYDYDLWGKRTVLDGGSPAESLVLHGFTGHVFHRWSGLWLAAYRAYSSNLGRWISRDPVGEAGGINLFAYVSNRPGIATDPLGWCDSKPKSPKKPDDKKKDDKDDPNDPEDSPEEDEDPEPEVPEDPTPTEPEPNDPPSWAKDFVDAITGGAASKVQNRPEWNADNAAEQAQKQRDDLRESAAASLKSAEWAMKHATPPFKSGADVVKKIVKDIAKKVIKKWLGFEE